MELGSLMGKKININTAIIGASVVTLATAVYFIATKPVDKDISNLDTNSALERPAEVVEPLLIEKELTQGKQGLNTNALPNSAEQQKTVYTSNTFINTAAYEAASRFGLLPSNMRDVAIEQFEFDENGELVLSSKVKNIIEFFLLASESEGYDQAVARLEEYIELTLPDAAQGQALEVVKGYLAYKQNMQDRSFPMTTDFG